MVAEAPDQALMAAETPGPRGAPATPALASAAHVYLEFAGDIPCHGLYLYDAGVLPEFPGSPPPMQLAPPDGPSLPAHHGPRQQKRAAVMHWWRRLRGSDNNAIACALRVCPGHERERGLAPKALDPSCIKAVLRCLQGPNFLGGSGRWNYSQPALDPQEHAAMAARLAEVQDAVTVAVRSGELEAATAALKTLGPRYRHAPSGHRQAPPAVPAAASASATAAGGGQKDTWVQVAEQRMNLLGGRLGLMLALSLPGDGDEGGGSSVGRPSPVETWGALQEFCALLGSLSTALAEHEPRWQPPEQPAGANARLARTAAAKLKRAALQIPVCRYRIGSMLTQEGSTHTSNTAGSSDKRHCFAATVNNARPGLFEQVPPWQYTYSATATGPSAEAAKLAACARAIAQWMDQPKRQRLDTRGWDRMVAASTASSRRRASDRQRRSDPGSLGRGVGAEGVERRRQLQKRRTVARVFAPASLRLRRSFDLDQLRASSEKAGLDLDSLAPTTEQMASGLAAAPGAWTSEAGAGLDESRDALLDALVAREAAQLAQPVGTVGTFTIHYHSIHGVAQKFGAIGCPHCLPWEREKVERRERSHRLSLATDRLLRQLELASAGSVRGDGGQTAGVPAQRRTQPTRPQPVHLGVARHSNDGLLSPDRARARAALDLAQRREDAQQLSGAIRSHFSRAWEGGKAHGWDWRQSAEGKRMLRKQAIALHAAYGSAENTSVVEVGASDTNRKSLRVHGVVEATPVDAHGAAFEVEVAADGAVTVTRTDSDGGWDFQLKLRCTVQRRQLFAASARPEAPVCSDTQAAPGTATATRPAGHDRQQLKARIKARRQAAERASGDGDVLQFEIADQRAVQAAVSCGVEGHDTSLGTAGYWQWRQTAEGKRAIASQRDIIEDSYTGLRRIRVAGKQGGWVSDRTLGGDILLRILPPKAPVTAAAMAGEESGEAKEAETGGIHERPRYLVVRRSTVRASVSLESARLSVLAPGSEVIAAEVRRHPQALVEVRRLEIEAARAARRGDAPAASTAREQAAQASVSRAFPSWKRFILTEIYLCHACSHREIEDGNARAGPCTAPGVRGTAGRRVPRCGRRCHRQCGQDDGGQGRGWEEAGAGGGRRCGVGDGALAGCLQALRGRGGRGGGAAGTQAGDQARRDHQCQRDRLDARRSDRCIGAGGAATDAAAGWRGGAADAQEPSPASEACGAGSTGTDARGTGERGREARPGSRKGWQVVPAMPIGSGRVHRTKTAYAHAHNTRARAHISFAHTRRSRATRCTHYLGVPRHSGRVGGLVSSSLLYTSSWPPGLGGSEGSLDRSATDSRSDPGTAGTRGGGGMPSWGALVGRTGLAPVH
jgi:hypothetical protein